MFKELIAKASKKELTIEDMNDAVLAICEDNEKTKQAVKNLGTQVQKNKRGLQDIEEEYPLLPPEADDLSRAVKRKGVEVLGGKKSSAYGNKTLRNNVYRDIYSEVKRQYGLINDNGKQMSYKKLKRKYLKGALVVVETYVPPIAIENEITSEK